MAKRKRSSVIENGVPAPSPSVLPNNVASIASGMMPPIPVRRASTRKSMPPPAVVDPNPDTNDAIQDAPEALRASPDAAEPQIRQKPIKNGIKKSDPAAPKPKMKKEDPEDSLLSELSDIDEPTNSAKSTPVPSKTTAKRKQPLPTETADPEGEAEDEEANPEELQQALSRPPPVNSSYLPLPWKGRLGYACLNTYLRTANPPIFSSRTCRIASILEHRHPLHDPTQPEHPVKNRPDKTQPASIARGQAYVEALGLANASDIPKMLLWNDRYGIKFLRLSSEMFPFASHATYGYSLAPFATSALASAGRLAAALNHRLTTHPGQFTQLGSPREEVIRASIRDLEYHNELLTLLKLPPQLDRDAVMILHMGGIFGDKATTLSRFKANYAKLSPAIKQRLVLENDDVCYSVHDLLPICEELNIPLVLDYHHHNIVFDSDKLREGTQDIMSLYPRIKATWDRKGITQKMHYSEPTPQAITARQRRKHNPRVATLPPCSDDMDLMIEAKDKEQAVFELMRTFKLPGFDTFSDILPYVRHDENKAWKPPKKKTIKKPKKTKNEDGMVIEVEEADEPEPQPPPIIPDEEVSMGGPEGRVYWPLGMEEWLRPKKREVKPRDAAKAKGAAEKAAERRAEKARWQAEREASAGASAGASAEGGGSASASEMADGYTPKLDIEASRNVYDKAKGSRAKPARAGAKRTSKKAVAVPTPSTSDHDEGKDEDTDMPDLTDGEEVIPVTKKVAKRPQTARSTNGRAKKKAVNYAEGDDGD